MADHKTISRKLKLQAAKIQLNSSVGELNHAMTNTDSTFYILQLPFKLLGHPHYEVNYTAELLMLHLKKLGYDVYKSQDGILVSWDTKFSIQSIIKEHVVETTKIKQETTNISKPSYNFEKEKQPPIDFFVNFSKN